MYSRTIADQFVRCKKKNYSYCGRQGNWISEVWISEVSLYVLLDSVYYSFHPWYCIVTVNVNAVNLHSSANLHTFNKKYF